MIRATFPTAARALAVVPFLLATAFTARLLGQEAAGPELTALGRPSEEVARDATSKPLEVYRFFGIGEGSVVADLIAGGGYNTAILTHVVGPDGVVFSQEGRRKAIRPRVASGDLQGRANVVVFDSLGALPADTLDVALTVRNYHDVPEAEVGDWLAAVKRALKPGGVFAVIDVRTKPGFEGRADDLHRISEDLVVEEVTAAGFELEARSDLLTNASDAYASSEFENREGTDRMVLKFRKAATGDEARPGSTPADRAVDGAVPAARDSVCEGAAEGSLSGA